LEDINKFHITDQILNPHTIVGMNDDQSIQENLMTVSASMEIICGQRERNYKTSYHTILAYTIRV